MPVLTPQAFMSMLTDTNNTPKDVCMFLRSNFFRCPVSPEMGEHANVAVFRLEDDVQDIKNFFDLAFSDHPQHQNRSYPFNAAALQVMYYKSVEDRLHDLPALNLPVDSDTLVMISAQLSGCTIVFQPSRDEYPYVKMAHIKPEGMSGAQLQRTLELKRPRFSGETLPTRLFGSLDYSGYANIIALLRKRQWTFYAQIYADASKRNISQVIAVDMFQPVSPSPP